MSPIVFVYGFPPKMQLDEFRAEFFQGIDESSYVAKIDFKSEKIYAFIHTNTQEQAQELIDRWHDKPMKLSGENKLQVRFKGDGSQGGSNNQGNNQGNGQYNNQGGYQGNKNNNQGGYNNNMNRNKQFGGPGGGYNSNRNNNNNGGGYNQQNNNGGYNNNNNSFNNNRGPNMNRNNNYNNQNQNQNQGGFTPNNMNQNQGGNGGFMNNNRNNQNNNQGGGRNNQSDGYAANLGPQKPVLYVYGFPKDMEQNTFEAEFLAGVESGHKQTDYFKDKLYCFIHCHDTETCDTLIEKWDQKTMSGSSEGAKPLQVRYKGMDSKLVNMLSTMSPVLWVYGFPKGMTEEEFRGEFLCGMEVDKIDYFEQKLYAFVHCKDSKQGIKLINKWEGKMMSKSKSNLQVRFKNIPNKQTTYYNNQNQAMGDMNQQYNQTFGNNGQYFNNMNNMQRQNQYNMNNMNNMGFAMNQQQGFNNRNMQNQFVNRQQNWNNPMQGGMMDNMMGNNMQQGGYKNNRQGGFNNRQQPHFNNQHNQMNDGNNQFRGNQQHPQQMQFGNAMMPQQQPQMKKGRFGN